MRDDEIVVRHGPGAPKAGFSAAGPVGGSTWHRALKVAAEAAPRHLLEGGESIGSLKQRASVAIPVVGARIQAWNHGSGAPTYWSGTLGYGNDAVARNTAYTSMWHQLEPNRGRYWFEAAGMVTGRGGIKSLEGGAVLVGGLVREARDHFGLNDRVTRIVKDVPTPDDTQFVISGNAFLYPFNLHNFFTLRDKLEVPGFERVRGEDLDRGLVVLEQTLVQQFIESYPWASKAVREASLRRITGGFFDSWANAFVREMLVSTCGRAFSFGSLDDRIRLGIALVAKLRWLG